MSSNPATDEAMSPEPESDPGGDGGSVGSGHGDPKQEKQQEAVTADVPSSHAESVVNEFPEEVAVSRSEKDGRLHDRGWKHESSAEVVEGSSEKEESSPGSSDQKGDAVEGEKSAGGEAVPSAAGGSAGGLLNSADAQPETDVVMMEDAEEVVVADPSVISGAGMVSVVAEVKVEEKDMVADDVTMADVAQEEVNVTTDNAMCTTESAPVIAQSLRRESGEGAQALDEGRNDAIGDNGFGESRVHAAERKVGDQSGEEKLEVQAGSFQSMNNRKPDQVEVVDVGIEAVASETTSAMDHDAANGLITLDHTAVIAKGSTRTANQTTLGPESNKLGTDSVNGTPSGIGIEESNKCIALDNKEIENNMAVVVEEGCKIPDDSKPPAVEQQGDRVGLLKHAEEQISGSGGPGGDPGNDNIVSAATLDQRARYCLPPLDKDGFQVSDLVWGKVKSHPWWPGQIFDPSDASELALRYQKKDNFLVAYFGDNTFAWCDESQLKPFLKDYSQMEKQSSSDAFVNSVNSALEEVSRRVLSGMSCSCLPEELCDNSISNMVENAGIMEGLAYCEVDRSEILNYFNPENLLHYVKMLARLPGQGGDLLDLVIASSQLTAFYRSKGCPELPSFQTGSAWVENDLEALSSKSFISGEAVTDGADSSHGKPRRGRGRPPKRKHAHRLGVSSSELTDKKTAFNMTNGVDFDDSEKRQVVMDFDDFDEPQSRKKISLDSLGDLETKSSTPTFRSSFKIGECIRRAASQLTGSSSIVKSQTPNEPTVHKNASEAENGEFDISSEDTANEPTVEKRAKRRRMHRNHSADPEEVLSQLCLVATEPLKGYNFSSMIISYFSDYRNFVVSAATEASVIEKVKAKRGRKRKVLPSSELDLTDHMQDSYWSALGSNNHRINNDGRIRTNMWPSKRRASQEMVMSSSDRVSTPVQRLQVGILGPKKQRQVVERSIIHVEEKMVDECKPTALVLSFGRSTVLPSETDLIKMFSRYGPLKEAETEVHASSNSVKVVFKKRADAERAFSIAGKYGTFGPALRSYRLVNMPFSLSIPEGKNREPCPENRVQEDPAPEESKVRSVGMPVTEAPAKQVNAIDQTVHAEAVEEALLEHVDVMEQSGQAESASGALVEEVATTKQAGQVEVGNEASVEQLDMVKKTAETEALAEASVDHGDAMEQAEQMNTRIEASPEVPLDTKQAEGVTRASVEGIIDETKFAEASTSVEVASNTMRIEAASEAPIEDTFEQIEQAEAPTEAPVEDTIEKTERPEDPTESPVQVLVDTIQCDAVTKVPEEVAEASTSVEVASNTMRIEAASEAPIEDTFEQIEQAEAPAEAPVEDTIEKTERPEDPTEAPVQVLVDTIQCDAVTKVPEEAEVCLSTQGEAGAEASSVGTVGTFEQTAKEKDLTEASVEVMLTTVHVDAIAEAPEGAQVRSDILQFEARTLSSVEKVDAIEQERQAEALNEDSIVPDTLPVYTLSEACEDAMQVDAADGAAEKVEVPLDRLQAEAVPEQSIEQDATEQTMQFRDPNEESFKVVSNAIPADFLEVQGSEAPVETPQYEAVIEATVDQVDTIVQPASVEQTAPVEALTEASVEQAAPVEALAEASAEVGSIEVAEASVDAALVEALTEASIRQAAPVQALTEATVQQAVPAQALPEASVRQMAPAEALPEVSVREAAHVEALPESSVEQAAPVGSLPEASVDQAAPVGSLPEASVEQAAPVESLHEEQSAPVEALREAPIEQAAPIEALPDVSVEQAAPVEALTEISVEQAAPVKTLPEASVEHAGRVEASIEEAAPVEALAEASIEDAGPVEALAEASVEAAAPVKALAEASVEAAAPVEALAEASVEAAAPVEALAEASVEHASPMQVLTESSIEHASPMEVLTEPSVEQAAHIGAPIEASVEQSDTTERTVELRASTEALAEQVYTIEQNMPVEDITKAEHEQIGTIKETLQAEAVTEASAEQVGTAEQTALVEDAARATTERVVVTEENVEVEATAEAPVQKSVEAKAGTELKSVEAEAATEAPVEGVVQPEAATEAPAEKAVQPEAGLPVEEALQPEAATEAPIEEVVEAEAASRAPIQEEEVVEAEAANETTAEVVDAEAATGAPVAEAVEAEAPVEEAVESEADTEAPVEEEFVDAVAATEAPVEEAVESEAATEAPVEEAVESEAATEAPVEEEFVDAVAATEAPVEGEVVDAVAATEAPVEEEVVDAVVAAEAPIEEEVVDNEAGSEAPVEAVEAEAVEEAVEAEAPVEEVVDAEAATGAPVAEAVEAEAATEAPVEVAVEAVVVTEAPVEETVQAEAATEAPAEHVDNIEQTG